MFHDQAREIIATKHGNYFDPDPTGIFLMRMPL
jgi:hypothetical protein